MAIYLGQQLIGAAGGGSGSSTPTQEQINTAVNNYLQAHPVSADPDYIFETAGTNNPGYLFNSTTKVLQYKGAIYNTVEADLGSAEIIRFCGYDSNTSLGALNFVDEDGELVECDGYTYAKGTAYRFVTLKPPAGAVKVYVSGSSGTNGLGGYLEFGYSNRARTGKGAIQDLFGALWGRLSKQGEKFAWKSNMPTCIAFTFDDTLDSLPDTAAIFKEHNMPMCFGCIPERMDKTFDTSTLSIATDFTGTAASLMHEMVDDYGGEVLAHGSDAYGIVKESNIDDNEYLFKKFVEDKIKFIRHGFDVRGIVRVGGAGNITNDPRTDVWVRALYDYGDLYGTEEPHFHTRTSPSSNSDETLAIAEDKQIIDAAITRGGFTAMLYHNVSNARISAILDYVAEKQSVGDCIVTNYAYAYDNYGSTVSREADLAAIREQITGGYSDGDEEEY